MQYDFYSIVEFIDYITNSDVRTDAFSSLSSENGSYSFTKTNSLSEAKELCTYGWHDNYEKLIELKLKIEKYIKIVNERNRQYNYYVGYAPDVKAYLEGNPLSMLNRHPVDKQHIDIFYNAAILSDVSTSQIFNRGAITLSLVEILESMGFNVGLNVFTMSEEGPQLHYANFKLKRTDERLNAQKLFFPLCHPSFLRRLVFRLREVTPDIMCYWSYSYGHTCSDNTIRKILDLSSNDIVICTPEEMGVNGYDIIEDANNMFDYLNELPNKPFVLEKVKK